MDTQTTKSEYLLLFRSTDWDNGLSPEEMQEVMGRWTAWHEELTRQGNIKGARPLMDEGKIVSGKKGSTVADGPFAESKEAIAGYFLVEVENIEEAVKIARQWPILDYGATVEVRPVTGECQTFQRAKEEFARAAV